MSHQAFRHLLKIGHNVSKLTQQNTPLRPSTNVALLFNDPLARLDTLLEPLVQMPEGSSDQQESRPQQKYGQRTDSSLPHSPNMSSTSHASNLAVPNSPTASMTGIDRNPGTTNEFSHFSGNSLPARPIPERPAQQYPTPARVNMTRSGVPSTLDDPEQMLHPPTQQPKTPSITVPRSDARSIMDDPEQFTRAGANLPHDTISERSSFNADENAIIQSQATMDDVDDPVQSPDISGHDAVQGNPAQLMRSETKLTHNHLQNTGSQQTASASVTTRSGCAICRWWRTIALALADELTTTRVTADHERIA